MSDNIHGTGLPNTEEGAAELRRLIVQAERDRVKRNEMRKEGHYEGDLTTVQSTLEAIDVILDCDVSRWDYNRVNSDYGLEERLSAAHETLARYRAGTETLETLVSVLQLADEKLATVGRDLAEQAITLAAIIEHIENGEPE